MSLLDVDLELFLRFNKIRALVDNTLLLAKALKKSEVLQVIALLMMIKRCKLILSIIRPSLEICGFK